MKTKLKLVTLIVVSVSFLSLNVNSVLAATIISSVGTDSTITKGPSQHKIIYDGTRWWAFYMKSGTANTLFYAYSSDLSTWTESSVALLATVNQNGGFMDVLYDSGSGAVLVTYLTSTADFQRYMRGNISGTTISSWTATDRTIAVFNPTGFPVASLTLDSSGIPFAALADNGGNASTNKATNAISTSFTDAPWSAANGIPALNDVTHAVFAGKGQAAGNLFIISDDLGVNPEIAYSTWNGAAWAAYTNIYSGANVDRSTWAALQISSTDTRLIGISNTNTLTFMKYDGTSWSTLTAPTYPSGGIKASSIALTSDGTDVWAFVIQNDAPNTISYNKYHGTTWSGWTDLVATTATRNFLSAAPSVRGNKAVIAWTQTNGANFDFYVESLSTAAAATTLAVPRLTILRGILNLLRGILIIR